MTSLLILSDQKEGNKKPGGRGILVEGLVNNGWNLDPWSHRVQGRQETRKKERNLTVWD